MLSGLHWTKKLNWTNHDIVQNVVVPTQLKYNSNEKSYRKLLYGLYKII